VGDGLRLPILLLPVFIIAAAKVLGLYEQDELRLKKSTLDEVPALFSLATLTALMGWLAHPYLVEQPVGRDQVVLLWGSLFASFVAFRVASRGLARWSTPPERCLIVGSEEAARGVGEKIAATPSISVEVAGHAEIGDIVDRPGRVSDALADLAGDTRAERVVIAARDVDQHGVLDIVRAAKLHGLRVTMLPRMVEAVGSSIVFDDVDGTLMLGVRHFGLTRSSRFLKRSFDLVASALGLIAIAPFLALVSLAIKLDSKGPVLFRHARVGRDGATFHMHKFRTMVADAEQRKADFNYRNEAVGLFKIAGDPRITRLGRWLRRTSLDELPQLWDVLCGRMSLVGPRPLIASETEQIDGWARRRLELAPGMTGRWQVLGSARIPLQEMSQLDYLYAANWSLWADIKILLRTVPFVVGRRGL
jgi:exopolysaccharide biosynthesis polyprenyl glycosylphosphotransferase